MTFSQRLLTTCIASLLFCSLVVPLSAQHFEQITGTLTQVAAGRNEVFGIGTSNQIYRYIAATKTFGLVPGSLTRVAVGGGSLNQKDEVWGIGTSGQIYHFNFATKTFTQVTGSLAQIVVGEGVADNCHTYEVWGINASDNIFRYNYCTSQFEQIAGSLSVVATGGGSVWGLNGSAQIYYYNNGFSQVAGSLQQIATSGNDVFGLDGSGYIYRFDPYVIAFVSYGAGNTAVATGGDGVWIIQPGYVLNYLEAGTFFYKVSMTQLAVGYGAGVWAVDSSNRVWTFVRP